MSVDPTNGKPLPTPEEVSHSLQKLAYHTKKNGVGMTSPLNREELQKQVKLFAKIHNYDDRDTAVLMDSIDQYAQQVAIEATKTLQAKVKAQEMFTKDAIREARIDENKSWKRRIGEHSDEDTSYYDNRIAELEQMRSEP